VANEVNDDTLAYADYGKFHVGSVASLEGGRVWWHGIIPQDRERIMREIHLHAAAYQKRGYGVEMRIDPEETHAEIEVKFPKSWRVTKADIELLKGELAASEVTAGWGGPGAVALFFAVHSLMAGIGLA